jgi:hypothetical protein
MFFDMKRMNFYIIPVLSLAMVSCTHSEKNRQEEQNKEVYNMPVVPSTLNTPEARSEYLMAHYWDNFNFSDTSMTSRPKISEQAFADYVNILNNIPPETAGRGISLLMEKAGASSAMLLYFEKLSEKYLYDPNSPVRNELLFEYFLKSVLKSTAIDETHKIRLSMQLKIVQKNRPGSKATDFSYTLPGGKTFKLSALDAELVVLYFNNPECHDCSTVKEQLSTSKIINALIQRNLLKILAVYPDEDITIYRKHVNEMPSDWINAYNKGAVIKNRELYDLKAIPTLYLLDKNKTILLKDATFEILEAYLGQNYC